MEIIETIKQKSDLLCGEEIDEKMILEAERKLEVKFSDEFRKYLSSMSIAAYGGHELTGLTKPERTNVVSVTKKMREIYPDLPKEWYVIEEANIDDIVIWQDEKGVVYKTVFGNNAGCIASSFSEFVANF